MPSWRSESGQEALPELRDGLARPPAGLAGVGTSYHRSKRGWEALPEVEEGLGGSPGGTRGVGTSS